MTRSAHPLIDAPPGRSLRIRHLSTPRSVSLRLREIGFQENAVLLCVSNSHLGVICDIAGGRFGLNHDVARNIHVCPLE
jgi:Fe2+ transport system protein FeoA